jgi:serralysin
MNSKLAGGCAVVALAASLIATATADAGTVRREGNTVVYKAAVREDNFVRVFQEGGEVAVSDGAPSPAHLGAGPGCRLVVKNVARCGFNVTGVSVETFDEGDTVLVDTTTPTVVDAGSADDMLHAGRAPGASRIRWIGGAGFDTITYTGSSRAVTVRKNGVFDDGRPAFGDTDNVGFDVERIDGSPSGDVLEGHSLDLGFEVFQGGAGNDRISGNGGQDRFIERGEATGADVISGGAGADDVLEYGFSLFTPRRDRGVRVTLDGVADDGAPGEGDNVKGDIEQFLLTQHADTFIGTGLKEVVNSLEGGDFIDGRGGADDIDCDEGRDTALLYPGDVRRGCESVGTFRLSPRTVRAKAGTATAMTLRWTHPISWQRLDDVRLVLEANGREIGRVVFDQETGRVAARGGVALGSKTPRVRTADGKKRVTVQLAVKVARRYAGRTLVAKLGARADDGTSQAPERAGTIRVLR